MKTFTEYKEQFLPNLHVEHKTGYEEYYELRTDKELVMWRTDTDTMPITQEEFYETWQIAVEIAQMDLINNYYLTLCEMQKDTWSI